VPEAVLQVSRAILTLPMIPVSDDRPTHEGSGGNLLDYPSSRLSALIASTARPDPPSARHGFLRREQVVYRDGPGSSGLLGGSLRRPGSGATNCVVLALAALLSRPVPRLSPYHSTRLSAWIASKARALRSPPLPPARSHLGGLFQLPFSPRGIERSRLCYLNRPRPPPRSHP
jgi:hypothetical protein